MKGSEVPNKICFKSYKSRIKRENLLKAAAAGHLRVVDRR